ncbi:NADH-quinone oxidoreductase subunit N [Lacipirellula parvula]|uniref:NADH-quinone oxidoreductase subunit N n=1 Tax=Lacipirellula parvula TaxID=2650471 RepID=A0A5K7XAU8_9BACT|nr:NADH-quinone oxidoreductase subunit N [Lacipirellula parvula]BBO31911.1 NADH-ubiquinone oxidoreductase chain N [Lacipirellula parvula]
MATAIEQLNNGVHYLAPELILVMTICVMFITGPFFVTEGGVAAPGLRRRWGALALVAIGCAGFMWWTSDAARPLDTGPFRADALTWYVRGLTLALGAIISIVLIDQIDEGHSAESQACLLAILAGVNLTALANDLIVLFLALELVSIPTYVLLYLPRRGEANQEAAIKYMLLSVFSSAIVLYGMSMLYGAAGTTNLAGIAQSFGVEDQEKSATLVKIAVALLIAGLSFRIGAVPFHFYAPDVFQGIPSSAAALLSFVPKVVGFVALLRLLPLVGGLGVAEAVDGPSVRVLLAALAFVTMTFGNLLALRQNNLYRLMAYSSVAHAGYMLIGLVVDGGANDVDGVGALLFYLATYGLITIGVFALIAGVNSEKTPLRNVSDLNGLSRVHPAVALALAVCLFSLTGLPPTVGMLGKLNLFLASWGDGTTLGRWLAIVLAANAAISAWYYLRLIAVMFLEPVPAGETSKVSLAPAIAGSVCSLASILLFIAPQHLWEAAVKFVP